MFTGSGGGDENNAHHSKTQAELPTPEPVPTLMAFGMHTPGFARPGGGRPAKPHVTSPDTEVEHVEATNLLYRDPALYDLVQADSAGAGMCQILIELHCPDARTLVDFGCGTGRDLEILAKRFECIGVDLQLPSGEEAQDEIRRRVLFPASWSTTRRVPTSRSWTFSTAQGHGPLLRPHTRWCDTPDGEGDAEVGADACRLRR
ncbi:hypothetical protein ACIQPR_04285 [Streptomyces sp. NPDC091280]|uniref:hypothetical protein n=1 Tax=Streptomyces sp. NPDC091280 TaxID=3365984 RepID=UPI003828FE38